MHLTLYASQVPFCLDGSAIAQEQCLRHRSGNGYTTLPSSRCSSDTLPMLPQASHCCLPASVQQTTYRVVAVQPATLVAPLALACIARRADHSECVVRHCREPFACWLLGRREPCATIRTGNDTSIQATLDTSDTRPTWGQSLRYSSLPVTDLRSHYPLSVRSGQLVTVRTRTVSARLGTTASATRLPHSVCVVAHLSIHPSHCVCLRNSQ